MGMKINGDEKHHRPQFIPVHSFPALESDAGAGKPADEGMRGTGGQAPPPCQQVPRDGTHQPGQHDLHVNRVSLLNVDDFGDRVRHLGREYEHGHEVEKSRPQDRGPRRKHPRGNHRGDRVGGVMKAVDGIEHQRRRHRADHQHPESGQFHLNLPPLPATASCNGTSSADQAFFNTTPSMALASCHALLNALSMRSYTWVHLMISIISAGERLGSSYSSPKPLSSSISHSFF